MVITGRTRNALALKRAREFESHRLRHQGRAPGPNSLANSFGGGFSFCLARGRTLCRTLHLFTRFIADQLRYNPLQINSKIGCDIIWLGYLRMHCRIS